MTGINKISEEAISAASISSARWIPIYEDNSDDSWGIPGLVYDTSDPNYNIDSTGIKFLWNIFFRDFNIVSQEEWNSIISSPESSSIKTNKEFYIGLFRDAIKGFYDILQNDSDYLFADDSRGNGPNGDKCNNFPFETFIGPHPPPGITTNQDTFTYACWLIGKSSPSGQPSTENTWYKLAASDLEEKWKYYLTQINAKQRTQSAFLWTFFLLFEILKDLQKSIEGQSERLEAITSAQKQANSAISDAIARLKDPSEASDVQTPVHNQQVMLEMQVYQSYMSVMNSMSDQQSNRVTSTQDGIQEQTNIMVSLIQQMETILNSLFK